MVSCTRCQCRYKNQVPLYAQYRFNSDIFKAKWFAVSWLSLLFGSTKINLWECQNAGLGASPEKPK